MKIDLEFGEATFMLSVLGDRTRSTYSGKFTSRCCLSPLQAIQSDSDYRQLLGKVNPNLATKQADDLSYVLCQLKYRITEGPSFWNKTLEYPGGDIPDYNIIIELFEKVMEAEKEYLAQLIEKSNKNAENFKKAYESGTLTNGTKPENE